MAQRIWAGHSSAANRSSHQNQAERDLCPVKTQLKISGCHAAETGAKNWLAIRSYLVTTLKHGLGALDAIRRAIFGEPWMPPLALLA